MGVAIAQTISVGTSGQLARVVVVVAAQLMPQGSAALAAHRLTTYQ
jgi:hypothetical protein